MIQQSVADYFDEDIYDQMIEDYDEKKPDIWYDEKQKRVEMGNMIMEITEAFKPGWDAEYYEDADDDNDDDDTDGDES